MTISEKSENSVWPLYLAAGGLGIAFLLVLLVLAWDNAVEREVQRFGYESLSVDDTVRTNVQAANDAVENLARILGVAPDLSHTQLEALAQDLLKRYPFLVSLGHYRADADGSFALAFGHQSNQGDFLPKAVNLDAPGAYAGAFAGATQAPQIIPSERISSGDGAGSFLLAKSIAQLDGSGGGIVVAVVSPSSLLENIAASPDLAVTLYSESEGIGGRQLLFERAPSVPTGRWEINTLEESTQMRFDRYSIRLNAAKRLYWADLGKALLFTAAVLGIGVTLLLVALARAKELQARELLARNKVIEEQVTRQTYELAEARDQALEASRVKSDFLASMSHEIRTPLNAIIGMAELLGETRLSGDQLKYVSVFKNAGEALLSLVNDILDLSKIEAGQLILEEIDYDVRELVEQSAEIYALKTDSKGIELASHVARDVPPNLRGDPSRLRQVILNLIGNAIKFTDQGEIVVRVELVEEIGDSLKLLFSVSDTGIGIPGEKLESIFGSFTQVDSSTTRKYGGTGLGLTISQKLVEKMAGRIWVESAEGKGSTFKFEITCARGESPVSDSKSELNLSGARVLVIDDNETNRLILRETLEPYGAIVSEAANGNEALAIYRAAQAAGEVFELVLCDVQMPQLDGFGVTEQIIAGGGTPNTIMMLSSANLGTDLERARDLGLREYLVKPLKRADLLSAIGVARAKTEQATVKVAHTKSSDPDTAPHDTRILLVEDNPDNRMLIKAYLKKQPYIVDEAENGEQALSRYKQTPYDLVLMDVQMPVMDGHTATQEIRAFEAAEGRPAIPIIALTAHAIKEDRDKSLAAGCTAHLTKPIKKQTLIDALSEHLVGA